MCMKRQDDVDRFEFPFPMSDFIDLTAEDIGDDDIHEMIQRTDEWNYPYNLLPSADGDEPARGFIGFDDSDSMNDVDSLEDMDVEFSRTLSATRELTDFLANDDAAFREFELNIPQILLSMTRISTNLHERAASSHD